MYQFWRRDTSNTGNDGVGGIVGKVNSGGVITDCYNKATISANDNCGGLVGILRAGSVTNSYSVGNVNCASTSAGAIIGNVNTDGSASNCYYSTTMVLTINGSASTLVGYGSNTGTSTVTTAEMTAEQFASGEVAYLLAAGRTGDARVWGQTIGTDKYPVIDGEEVFEVNLGESEPLYYSNLNNVAEVAELPEMVKGGLYNIQVPMYGIRAKDGALYARTQEHTTNLSKPNDGATFDSYEDSDLSKFNQYEWVKIAGIGSDEYANCTEITVPFRASFDGDKLIPVTAPAYGASAGESVLNMFRPENVLHGQYTNYADDQYPAFYVLPKVNEVATFIGNVNTINGEKYLYTQKYGTLNGKGVKVEVADVAELPDADGAYRKVEGILVKDATANAGYKILFLADNGLATGVEANKLVNAEVVVFVNGENVMIRTTAETTNVAIYDVAGGLVKTAEASAGITAIPMAPGYYIVRCGNETTKVSVK